MLKNRTNYFVLILAIVLAAALAGCGSGIYSNDDAKKSYDKKYVPTTRDPLALSGDQSDEITKAVADMLNDISMAEYEDAMTAYNEAVIADALAAAADSSAAAAASKTSSEYVSTYTPAELTEPEEPELKTMDDVKIYAYGGTWNGYIALEYKVKGRANVSAHHISNLAEDIIGNYNFSAYPDSPIMALYKDGSFYTIREVYEAGGITDQNLKDIWYYFYVEQ